MRLDDHPTVKRYREKSQLASDSLESEKIEAGWLKKLVMEAGAHDVGLVEIDRPEIGDQREDILAVFPKTKTLVSIVCRLNRENIRCVSRAVSDLEFVQTFEGINGVARKVVGALEERGSVALNYSGGFPMDLALWPGKMWPVSHKPIAIAAGLGHMGNNRLVIHPQFGNFIILDTIFLDREVTAYDRRLDFNPCLECKLCASVCPVGAIAPDGHFKFSVCMTHNYRDRLGGFSDWVEKVVDSKNIRAYRHKVTDPETVSMWQSLSYGVCNKSSYCMAVCPAGEDVIGPFLDNRKGFIAEVVKPLQDKEESVFVVPGSDSEAFVSRHFPGKKIKRVGNGLRPNSAKAFLQSLSLVFQRDQSEGLDAAYHFTFTGAEDCKGTVVIRNKSVTVHEGHVGNPDLHVIADSHTWISFLAKEKNLIWALLTRKIRLKGSPRMMKAFARCFPS